MKMQSKVATYLLFGNRLNTVNTYRIFKRIFFRSIIAMKQFTMNVIHY